jgi:hypothetical protein
MVFQKYRLLNFNLLLDDRNRFLKIMTVSTSLHAHHRFLGGTRIRRAGNGSGHRQALFQTNQLTRRFTMKLPRRVLGLLTGTKLFSTAVFARTLDGMNNRTGMMNL